MGDILPYYSLNGLQRHTNYILTVAAKNLEGLGPEASIQLRTEDGGIGDIIVSSKFPSSHTKFEKCRTDLNFSSFLFSSPATARFDN